jgi:hypothetical protein
MGDRCSVNVWVRKEHLEAFVDVIGGEDLQRFGGDYSYFRPLRSTRSWVNMQFDEVNYGCFDERLDAGRKGLIFFGTSTPGCSYDGEVFYSDGREMHSRDVGLTGYIVRMKNGKVVRGTVAAINKFEKGWRELHEDMRKELVEQSHAAGG